MSNKIAHINQTKEDYSISEIKEEYFKHFCEIFNKTDYYDSREKKDKFALFVKKISDGTLEIRKTLQPNHAKMYLLSYSEDSREAFLGTRKGAVIIGSSNLSLNGLRNQYEINAFLDNDGAYSISSEIFNTLWNDSIELINKDNFETFQKEVLNKIWFENVPKPFLMYLKVLDEYFSLEINKDIKTPNEINSDYANFRYQIDAIKIALNTIEKHNGVIIADVVGLGKSIIASCVARNLDLDTFIITPPHLIEQWREYKAQFGINAEIFSNGKLEDALDFYNKNLSSKQCLIIVDEAHRYRNQDTLNYKTLHELCMGNKVILLTATPFNNTPSDIYAMISLFQIPSKATLKTVNNLGAEFKKLMSEYKKLETDIKKRKVTEAEQQVKINEISKKIRTMIEPLIVRRSRIDLEKISSYRKDLKEQGISFPRVEDPKELNYNLLNILDKYIDTINKISPVNKTENSRYYKACRYSCLSYADEKYKEELTKVLKEQNEDFEFVFLRQKSLSDLMKRLLVRRFESSVYAFQLTLKNMIEGNKTILEWIIKNRKIPITKGRFLPDVDSDEVDDDINNNANLINENEKHSNNSFYTIDVKYINEKEFVNALKEDIKILEEIEKAWFSSGTNTKSLKTIDPKIKVFIKKIKEQIETEPNRKIIIFSEYSDTVDYIFQIMKEEQIRVFKYSSNDASQVNKKTIRANFDAGLKIEDQKNDYDVLVATDAISEGFSLHRAGTIFNYDIPYNPTRVIQRVGRINRINKKMFDNLYIYNFFPSDVGENETRTKKIATLKMAMIQQIVGEDTRILTENESLNSYFNKKHKEALGLIEEESRETKHREIWESYQGSELMVKARQIPDRTRIRRIATNINGVIVFGKRGSNLIFKHLDKEKEIKSMSPGEALDYFSSPIEEKGYKVSEDFDEVYQNLKKNLFIDSAKDSMKDRSETIGKLKLFERKTNDSYFKDLLTIVTKYDALSKYEIKQINKTDISNMNSLKEKIKPQYIKRIFKTVQDKNEDETIVLIEELEKGRSDNV